MEHTGYVAPGRPPKFPVEWAVVTPLDQIRVTSTDSENPNRLVEVDTRGWDKFGVRVQASGLDAGDTVVVTLESPEGAAYTSISMTAPGTAPDQSVAGISSAPIEIQSSKVFVSAYYVTATGTSFVDVAIVGYLKGGSYG
tara:strand:+ start:174 stop:593 length:420 start_codon:yes stop_codon:yes gene_type:complete